MNIIKRIIKRESVTRLLTALLGTAVIVLFRSLRKYKSKAKAPLPPMAKSKCHPFLFWLLGHVAELRPWDCDVEGGELSLRLTKNTREWLDSVPGTDTVSLKVGSNPVACTTSLSIISNITKNGDSFRSSDSMRSTFGRLFPNSVISLTGDKWAASRKNFVKAINRFDFNALPKSTSQMLLSQLNKIEETNVETEVNVMKFLAPIAFDTFMKFAFDLDFGIRLGKEDKLYHNLEGVTELIFNRILNSNPLLWYLPFGTTPKLFRMRDEIKEYVSKEIDERIRQYQKDKVKFCESGTRNFIDTYIIAMFESDSNITKVEVIGSVITSMIASFDATSSTLSLICLSLCSYPQYQDKLYEEIKDIDFTKASQQQLDELPYLNSIIKESQRYHAAPSLLARVTNHDMVIDGYFFKKDTEIWVDAGYQVNDPKKWSDINDLDQFKPERWFNFEPEANVFTPFGFGRLRCPGQKVARIQLQTIVGFLVKTYKLDFGSTGIEKRYFLAMSASKDSTMKVTRRPN